MEIFNSAKTINMAIVFFRLVLGISLTLGCVFFAKLSFATELQPYDLHYTANLGGMKIEARHQLKQNSGKYSIETQAKNFLGTISEKGSFKISDSGQIVPLRYSRKQKSMVGNRSETHVFDWASNSLLYTFKKSQGTIAVSPGQFDRLSLTQQMRLDLTRGTKEFSYTLFRKGKFKQYQYRVVGNEMINLNSGSFNTVMVERLEQDSSKNTKIWFASDWDFVVLKMETFEKNSQKTMVFDHGELNGNSILPLKNTVEI